jgi:hypothetical protein
MPLKADLEDIMVSALDWLYGLAQPFVWHPGRALFVALVLALVGYGFRRRGGRAPFVAAAAWAVFALLEFSAWRERANIRVDLLVTWPVLCLITVACLLLWVRRLARRDGTSSGAAP